MSPLYRELTDGLRPLYGEGEARALALLVLEAGFGVGRTDVYADKVRHFSAEERKRLDNMSRRLLAGEPVQYVLGRATFRGRDFRVGPGVLIPRPETEELVTRLLAAATGRAEGGRPTRVLDAGTGSGCIAVSVALELPGAEVEAWDIAAEALATAGENARRLGAAVNVERHDLLGTPPAGAAFDFIVSNPPYVCDREREDMERHVLDHEPHVALFVPDDDPLRFYRALARLGQRRLATGGGLLVEINCAYGEATAGLLRREGYDRVAVRQDAFGRDRIVEAWWPGSDDGLRA